MNYRSAPRPDDAAAFSSQRPRRPGHAVLQAYAGDPMRVHVIGAPGSEQPHVFSLGGLRWSTDAALPGANTVEAAAGLRRGRRPTSRSSAAPAARAA